MIDSRSIILQYIKGKDVLDIGSCGNQGSNNKLPTQYEMIKQNANSVQGVDLESNMPEIIKGNAETINLDKQFDVITAGDVIEHLHNVGLFLDNMNKHLKQDGILILVTPNVKSIGYLPFRGNLFHTCWYCEHTLKYIVEKHNFKVEKVYKGLRKRKSPLNDFLRNIFANNLIFVCRKN